MARLDDRASSMLNQFVTAGYVSTPAVEEAT
jgi:hypothetical protein